MSSIWISLKIRSFGKEFRAQFSGHEARSRSSVGSVYDLLPWRCRFDTQLWRYFLSFGLRKVGCGLEKKRYVRTRSSTWTPGNTWTSHWPPWYDWPYRLKMCWTLIQTNEQISGHEPNRGVQLQAEVGRLSLLMHKPFPKRQILDISKLKDSADDNFKFDENGRKFSKWVENTLEKGLIARLREIYPFPTVFSKDYHCRQVKTKACLKKGLSTIVFCMAHSQCRFTPITCNKISFLCLPHLRRSEGILPCTCIHVRRSSVRRIQPSPISN